MTAGQESVTGFDGLSAYRTDVEAAIAAANRAAAGPKPVRGSGSTSSNAGIEPVHRDRAFSAGAKKVVGWGIGIGIIVAIKLAASSGPSTTSAPNANPGTDAVPPVISVAPSAGTDESATPASNPTSNADANPSATSSDWQAQDATASASTDPTANDPTAMSKPDVSAVAPLTISELRYCLAEDVRIGAESSELEDLRSSNVDRFNRNVDEFNSNVTDFQTRCVHRSYRTSDKEIAQPQIDAQRASLQQEGVARVL